MTLLSQLNKLAEVFKKKAVEHKGMVMMGRSHGVHAEPTTFGLKMALYYEETLRNIQRMQAAKDTIAVGMISGARQEPFANIDPSIEEYVCEKLKPKPAKVSTQRFH